MTGGRSWRRRWGWWAAVVLLLLVVLAVGTWVWVKAPTFYARSGTGPDAQATATATTRAGVFAVFAATIAALAASLALMETRRANLAADQRERYTNAINQLGDDKPDVRLGGIYGLERIAEDSPRDAPTIVEVLCVFVRSHGRGPNKSSYEALAKHRPPIDVQAALKVISHVRRRASDVRVDLSEAHLERANLIDADFARANLDRARIERAELIGANLAGANLTGADLTDANLSLVHLGGATLIIADLTGANLYRADLTGANLTDANLYGTNLPSANLSGALLTDVGLTGADLYGANLTGADLTGAELSGADLTDVKGLAQSQLEETYGNETTRLPNGLKRPASWVSSSAGGDGD